MFLAHLPVNHHLRPLYRALAVLAGLYLIGFGVAGVIQAGDLAATAQDGLPKVLGQPVNLASAVLSLAFGAVVIVVTALGRNLDHLVNFYLAFGLWVVGLAMLALARTDANVLGFSVTNVVVWFVLGTVLSTAAMYSKIAP